jgi:hypothetical protein
MEEAWPVAAETLRAREGWVREFLKSPPQTNEVRRAVGLWPGLCAAAEAFEGPMDVLELGASAGLNLSMDRFHYDGGTWQWDSAIDGPRVAMSTQWSGPSPRFPAHAAIRNRAACDQNPLNASKAEDRLRLRSYIWPDQPERLERLNAAMEIAAAQAITGNNKPSRADIEKARRKLEKLTEHKLLTRLDGTTGGATGGTATTYYPATDTVHARSRKNEKPQVEGDHALFPTGTDHAPITPITKNTNPQAERSRTRTRRPRH